jgi:hypothetical protein
MTIAGLHEVASALPEGEWYELRILLRRDGDETTVHISNSIEPREAHEALSDGRYSPVGKPT